MPILRHRHKGDTSRRRSPPEFMEVLAGWSSRGPAEPVTVVPADWRGILDTLQDDNPDIPPAELPGLVGLPDAPVSSTKTETEELRSLFGELLTRNDPEGSAALEQILEDTVTGTPSEVFWAPIPPPVANVTVPDLMGVILELVRAALAVRIAGDCPAAVDILGDVVRRLAEAGITATSSSVVPPAPRILRDLPTTEEEDDVE